MLFPTLNVVYFCITTFRSVWTVPNMAVSCSSLTCFPTLRSGIFWMILKRFQLNLLLMLSLFFFAIYKRCICIVRSLYIMILSASFLIIFLSPEVASYFNPHFPFALSRITISGLLISVVLSVCTCWFHNMATLPPWLVSTDFGTWSYQGSLSNLTTFSFLC